MDSTIASLGDKGDQCITVGELSPLRRLQIEVQGIPWPCWAWKCITDSVGKPVTMMQAGDGAHLKGFIAGPFNVKVGQSTHQVDLYVAP